MVELAAALEDDSAATVLDAVARLEPASVSKLANDVDRAPSTVSHHLSRLESADLVDRTRNGQSVETRLAPDVRSILNSTDSVVSTDAGVAERDLANV